MDTVTPVRTSVNAGRTRPVPAAGDLPRTAAKRPPARSFELIPGGEGSGLLVTTVGGLVTGYRCTEFPTPFDGRAFVLAKVFGGSDPACDTYHVFLSRNGQDEQCECRGF